MGTSGSILGNEVQRLEDPTLLTGDGDYVDDLVETGMLYVAFVRSPVAHGNLLSVDISDAESMPGVVAVYHARGDDLGLPTFQGFPMLPDSYNRPAFADDKVRLVGDVVAAVVAESRAQAVDAAQEVLLDIDPLPVIINAVDGLAPDAPLLFPDTGSNICFVSEFGKEGGDPCEGADAIAELTMVSQRLAGVPMENNGVLAIPTDDGLTLWVTHQAPHTIHAGYAPMLGLEPDKLRIVCPWVGGGFGPKAAGYIEHIIAGKAAMATRQAGEVGRDAIRGHGVAGARPRLRDDGATRREQRRQDRRARQHRGRRRRRVPGDRGDPADAHPDDVGRRVRHPQGPLRREDGAHQQHDDRCVPRGGAAGGDATDRAHHRRGRRPDRHGPRRDPPRELPAAGRLPDDDDHGRQLRLGRVREVARRRARGSRLRRPARRAGRPTGVG